MTAVAGRVTIKFMTIVSGGFSMLWWFVQNALIALVLAAIVWPLCRIRRTGPAVRHALWLLVLLKLVTPPPVTWPWSAPIVFEWLR
ncbi:MAG: hypothetical protein HY000_22245, partial [Planctomycetes bacterium]|nr:hypothetical protein [Planctomycetota bacterium]